MSNDQIVWLVLHLVMTVAAVLFGVAAYRGWFDGRLRQPPHRLLTPIAIAIMYVGMSVGAVPQILGASDDTAVRYVNVAFVFSAVGLAVALVGNVVEMRRCRRL